LKRRTCLKDWLNVRHQSRPRVSTSQARTEAGEVLHLARLNTSADTTKAPTTTTTTASEPVGTASAVPPEYESEATIESNSISSDSQNPDSSTTAVDNLTFGDFGAVCNDAQLDAQTILGYTSLVQPSPSSPFPTVASFVTTASSASTVQPPLRRIVCACGAPGNKDCGLRGQCIACCAQSLQRCAVKAHNTKRVKVATQGAFYKLLSLAMASTGVLHLRYHGPHSTVPADQWRVIQPRHWLTDGLSFMAFCLRDNILKTFKYENIIELSDQTPL